MTAFIERREFITLLGGAAAWPLAAHAQQPAMPVIGFLRSSTASGSAHLVVAFRQGLTETGFVEGQNVEDRVSLHNDASRSAAGACGRSGGPAGRINRGKHGLSGAGCQGSNYDNTILFVTGSDPVRTGLVASLNRPGGNITGVIFTTIDLAAKQLGLLHELVPNSSAIAVLRDPRSA